MSKVDTIREKYPKITQGTFNQLVISDTTPTKKYLDRMCHYWATKGTNRLYSATLVKTIKDFDLLLPYITNKDIYDKSYDKFQELVEVVEKAYQTKLEKEFVREGNIDVIYETEKYFVIKPLTFKASLKYGSNTKWCTAGRNYESTFNSYSKNNHLIYIIDKTANDKVSKIATLIEKSNGVGSLIDHSIQLWNPLDSNVNPEWFVKSGWVEDDLAVIISHIRLYCYKQDRLGKVKNTVKETLDKMKSINLTDLMSNLTMLQTNKLVTSHEFESHQKSIDDFISKINQINETIK